MQRVRVCLVRGPVGRRGGDEKGARPAVRPLDLAGAVVRPEGAADRRPRAWVEASRCNFGLLFSASSLWCPFALLERFGTEVLLLSSESDSEEWRRLSLLSTRDGRPGWSSDAAPLEVSLVYSPVCVHRPLARSLSSRSPLGVINLQQHPQTPAAQREQDTQS